MTKNKAETTEKIVEMLKSDTYTIAEVCKATGIVSNTYHNWKRDDEEFAKAIKDAKEECKDYLVVEAKKSLKKKIQGYTVEETKVVTVPSKELDENGRPKPRIKEQTTVKKHIAPDITAIIFALTNCDPESWRNRQYSEITGKGGKDLIKQLPEDELDKKIADLESKIKE